VRAPTSCSYSGLPESALSSQPPGGSSFSPFADARITDERPYSLAAFVPIRGTRTFDQRKRAAGRRASVRGVVEGPGRSRVGRRGWSEQRPPLYGCPSSY